jgi:hypothetical protein
MLEVDGESSSTTWGDVTDEECAGESGETAHVRGF